MDDLFKKIQKMDKESFKSYLGNKLLVDVLGAYETTFGAKEVYDEHFLDTVVNEYLSSGEESQKAFSMYLESTMKQEINNEAMASENVLWAI